MASAPPRADFTEDAPSSLEKWESFPAKFRGSTIAIPYIIPDGKGAKLEGITVADDGLSITALLSPASAQDAGILSLDLRPLAGISSRSPVSRCTVKIDDRIFSMTSAFAKVWDVDFPAGARVVEIIDNGPAALQKAAPPRIEPESEPEQEPLHATAVPPMGRSRRPEEKSETRKAAEDYWKRMDAVFDRTIRIAELSYETNRRINLIVVGIGIVSTRQLAPISNN